MPYLEELVEELYVTAGTRLTRYALMLTGSLGDAEDLVQDAVVKTFVAHRRIDDLGHAERYVRVTMRTTYIDRIRRDQRWRRLAPAVAATETTGDAYGAVDETVGVEEALASLPPRMRVAVTLRVFDDLTVADIASAMGIGVGTVKKHLQEARERLSTRIAFEVDDTEHVSVSARRAR